MRQRGRSIAECGHNVPCSRSALRAAAGIAFNKTKGYGADMSQASQLFSPISLGPVTLANRIMISPMCQYSARDGNATDWHLGHLGTLAISGAGLLCLEATAVTEEGRITHADLGLYSDANEEALRYVVGALREISPIVLGIQLSHAGRKASSRAPWGGGTLIPVSEGGWRPLAPSALPHKLEEPAPKAMDETDIEAVVAGFAQAARRAQRLGYALIEIHMAHGYLLHQFLSPLSTRREDDYGGSLENRMRFPLEVFDAVRAVFPKDRPVSMRVSGTDWVEGGWGVEQTLAFARALEARGCAAIHVSSGGLSPAQQLPDGPGILVLLGW